MPDHTEKLAASIKRHILGGAHVAIDCKDLERSIRFYTELLGFTVTQDLPISERIHLVFLSHNQMVVELIHFTNRQAQENETNGKLLHFCMLADEEAMPQMLESFRQLGVPIHEGLRYNPTVQGVRRMGSWCFFIHGPDGELIEFNS